jgi:hypothetical protein
MEAAGSSSAPVNSHKTRGIINSEQPESEGLKACTVRTPEGITRQAMYV